MKKISKKYFLFIVVGFLISISLYNNEIDPYIIRFRTSTFLFADLVNLTTDLLTEFIIILYLGITIYKLFIYSAPYYFVRQHNRKQWYKIEVGRVARNLFLMLLLIYVGILTHFCYRGHCEYIGFALLQFVLNYLFLLPFILLCNSLSLKFNSQTAYLIAYGLIMFMLFGLSLNLNTFKIETTVGYLMYLFNPLANLVLNYHISSSSINFFSFSNSIPFTFSVVYLSSIVIVVFFVSRKITINHNLLDSNER